jgi:hypothetical protein
MSEDQKRIIRDQLQANARMVRRNAERGVVYAHGQGPVNSERLQQAQSFLQADQHDQSGIDNARPMSSSPRSRS